MLSQSLFYFPTTIVWLDDDWNHLSNISQSVDIPAKKFTHPRDAVNFFEHYVSPISSKPFFQALTGNVEYYDSPDHSPVDFDIRNILSLKDEPKKTSEISVAIVDFNMPEMNGIEFCQTIEHLPVKKILLTGEKDLELAISAFNEGIIDKYIQKGFARTNEELKRHIAQMCEQYFIDCSNPILAHLEAERKIPVSDPVFIRFFKEWCEEKRISEYYLFDKIGSFLCVNDQGETLHFIIHTDYTLDYLTSLYESQEIPELYNVIQAREKLPFLGIGIETKDIKNANWSDYLHTFETLQGREKYYWTVVK